MVAPSKPLNLTGQINYNNNTIEYQWTDSNTETSYQIRDMIGATPDIINDPIVLDNIPKDFTSIPYSILLDNWIRTENPTPSGSDSIALNGTWSSFTSSYTSGGNYLYSNVADSSLTFTFTGAKVRWIGTTAVSCGVADLYLDGNLVATIDTYSSSTMYQKLLYESPVLPDTPHSLKIVVTGRKNSNATGITIYLDAFDICATERTIISFDPTRFKYARYVVAVNADGLTASDPLTLYSKPPVAPTINYDKATDSLIMTGAERHTKLEVYKAMSPNWVLIQEVTTTQSDYNLPISTLITQTTDVMVRAVQQDNPESSVDSNTVTIMHDTKTESYNYTVAIDGLITVELSQTIYNDNSIILDLNQNIFQNYIDTNIILDLEQTIYFDNQIMLNLIQDIYDVGQNYITLKLNQQIYKNLSISLSLIEFIYQNNISQLLLTTRWYENKENNLTLHQIIYNESPAILGLLQQIYKDAELNLVIYIKIGNVLAIQYEFITLNITKKIELNLDI